MIHLGKTTDGRNVTVDPTRLIDSRMLIQGGSGAGKSHLLRLIAEQAKIQTIVLDPEGEFVTLREAVDCVIVGTEGEIPADPRSAALLARRLMEMNVSSVIDLYDLKLHQRRAFVRNFLDSLINLPKSLWHPALVMLDEAHKYVPEKETGAESRQSVIDLMSQGRKRGYCGILATQRLAKVDKDASAECMNVFIGNTPQDSDRKRAADILGIDKAESLKLRDFAPGEFYCYGPALQPNGVTRFRTASVKTTHPKAGHRHELKPPEPSKRIKGVIGELADLSKQAETEIRDLEQAKSEIAKLKRELNAKPKPAADDQSIAVAVQRAEQSRDKHWQQQIVDYQRTHKTLVGKIDKALERIETAREFLTLNGERTIAEPIAPPKFERPVAAVSRPAARLTLRREPAEGDTQLGKCERSILHVLSQFPEGCDSGKLTLLSGYRFSGGFKNSLSKLRQEGFIEGANTFTMTITDAGQDCGPFAPLPQGQALRDYWLSHNSLGVCERKILSTLIEVYPEEMSHEELCETTGYQYSGGFKNSLSKLRTAGLLVGKNTEPMKASDHLF